MNSKPHNRIKIKLPTRKQRTFQNLEWIHASPISIHIVYCLLFSATTFPIPPATRRIIKTVVNYTFIEIVLLLIFLQGLQMRSGSVLLFRGKHSPGICMRLCVYLGPKCIFTAKSIIALNAVAYWGNQNVFGVSKLFG